MTWQQTIPEKITDTLRLTLRVSVFLNLFMLSLFSVYFFARFFWALATFLNRVLFSDPW